jgi:Fe-S cluster biogenesis protein NfuA
MENLQMRVQTTPNPNAKKFVLSKDVKTDGKVTFSSIDDCHHIDLARELYLLTNVTQIHFFENVVTITQNGLSQWDALEGNAKKVLVDFMPDHDANFLTSDEEYRKDLTPDRLIVEELLDQHIRPHLQMDGGDIQVINLEGDLLTVRYEGACGSCPSSQTGTLDAIRSTLRGEFNPNLDVITIE